MSDPAESERSPDEPRFVRLNFPNLRSDGGIRYSTCSSPIVSRGDRVLLCARAWNLSKRGRAEFQLQRSPDGGQTWYAAAQTCIAHGGRSDLACERVAASALRVQVTIFDAEALKPPSFDGGLVFPAK